MVKPDEAESERGSDMAQKRNIASDTDGQTLSDLLSEDGSGATSDRLKQNTPAPASVDAKASAPQSGQGPTEGLPGFSDLTDELAPDDFTDVILDMLDTGEERDPDSFFDDSAFHQPERELAQPSLPAARSRIRRLADVWQKRPHTEPAPEAAEQSASAEGLLEGVLANSNAAPPAPPTLDSVLVQSDLSDDGTTSPPTSPDAAVDQANLAFALLFAEEEEEAGVSAILGDPAADQDADPLADLLEADLLEADLLGEVLGGAEPEPRASAEPGPEPSASRDQPAPSGELQDDHDLDFDLDDILDEPEDDWIADLEEETPPQAVPDPEDETADSTATPAVAAMQDLVGDDLLAELLRDDDPAQTTAAAVATGPVAPPTPTPVPFKTPDPQPRREPSRRSGMNELDHVLQAEAARRAPRRKWLVRLIWLALLGGLLYVAFLPYRFEVGGEFVIQSSNRAEARARTSGEITALHAREGDWVEANEVIAVLSNWNQTRDVALIRSEGERLQAQLATLLEGARPEEVIVAEQALASADVQLAIRDQELARQETLFASGTIALKAVEDARSARDLAQSARDQAAAQLALVEAGPRETEIDALRATIAGNAEELAFAELMLEYTNIRAPASGQIVSSMNEVPIGHSLTVGGLLVEIEDNRTVIVEMAVPEVTIAEVTVGAPVELRLWSDPDDTITGTVHRIAPRAEEQDFGRVIRVQVEVPNPEGRLAANITGFGKILAEERPVWQAFSRAIERFFVIELWSWMP